MTKTFVEFIKTKINDDNPVGDLAYDISKDKKFPINGTSIEVINYLTLKTMLNGIYEVFIELLNQYKEYLNSTEQEKSEDLLDKMLPIFYNEKWKFFKESFSVEEVYLKRKGPDIYKVYCIDKNDLVLIIDLKTNTDLNVITLKKKQDINFGNALVYSIEEAIKVLEGFEYNTSIIKPNRMKSQELLEFLEKNR